jgi:actin cytoskeleton-regulatory complex protein PAN1
VDKSALEGIPKVERRRQEVRGYASCHVFGLMYNLQAIFELISTEADYVRDLQLIVRVRSLLSLRPSLLLTF